MPLIVSIVLYNYFVECDLYKTTQDDVYETCSIPNMVSVLLTRLSASIWANETEQRAHEYVVSLVNEYYRVKATRIWRRQCPIRCASAFIRITSSVILRDSVCVFALFIFAKTIFATFDILSNQIVSLCLLKDVQSLSVMQLSLLDFCTFIVSSCARLGRSCLHYRSHNNHEQRRNSCTIAIRLFRLSTIDYICSCLQLSRISSFCG